MANNTSDEARFDIHNIHYDAYSSKKDSRRRRYAVVAAESPEEALALLKETMHREHQTDEIIEKFKVEIPDGGFYPTVRKGVILNTLIDRYLG